jgi:FMN phosphatase YigB (HAD superfamily)
MVGGIILRKVVHRATFLIFAKIQSVKNIIFDLGGVILDLAVEKTLLQFSSLANIHPERAKELFQSGKGFLDYEKGLISDDEFRVFVRELFHVNATDEQLDTCWNAMLVRIAPAKLSLLTRLKEQYNVILLSNTNTIHYNYIQQQIMPTTGGILLDDYFHRSHYSHLMKMRKPDVEIYQRVLAENNIVAADTFFFDDNHDNIAGARAIGINAVHVPSNDFILTYFNA